MTVKYWVAKYVEDPIRNEPKNIGVMIRMNGILSGRFVGERDDGFLDQRKIRHLAYPAVYTQWRDFWRKKLRDNDIGAVVEGATTNYFVVEGGEVADCESSAASDVIDFLYHLLIGEGSAAAFGFSEMDEGISLASEITSALSDSEVLGGGRLLVRYPVVKGQPVLGRHVAHTPSFSQKNGRLYVMEYIDLSISKINKAKERAGWMAYMFADIHDLDAESKAYSLVRPEMDNASEQIEYARAVLQGESTIVNWADDAARNAFIEERRMVATLPTVQVYSSKQ